MTTLFNIRLLDNIIIHTAPPLRIGVGHVLFDGGRLWQWLQRLFAALVGFKFENWPKYSHPRRPQNAMQPFVLLAVTDIL